MARTSITTSAELTMSWLPSHTLGIVAPASAPRIPEKLEQGLRALASDGYQFHWNPKQLTKTGYLSGTDTQRAAQFNQTMNRTSYLLAVRGGYGSLRILDKIDYKTAIRKSGVLIGYSDITALQLSLFSQAGWRSISGPVVVEWHEITSNMKREVRRLLEGKLPHPVKGLKTEREGEFTGTLLGGNLSMIVRMIGSRYLPDMKGSLLFIEDIHEPPYRIDALFTQLRHAGILEGLGGLIVGIFTRNESTESETRGMETVLNCVRDYSWPVVSGLKYGHVLPRHVLPVGVPATLTANVSTARLDILESVFA